MLYAISGSQGTGKSTLLEKLQETYPSLRGRVVDRKTSRSILEDWNVSLKEVNDDPDLTISFQREIIKRKFEDESEKAFSDEIWFTERTFADLFTYCLITLGKDNTHSSFINEYAAQCMKYQCMYRHVFYLRGGLFPPVHDGVRGSNAYYGKMADLTMTHFTQTFTETCGPERLTFIDTADMNRRVEIVTGEIWTDMI